MDRGIKVALPGKRVETAGVQELAVDTTLDSLKFALNKNPAHFGVVTINFNANPPQSSIEYTGMDTKLFEFEHNLGYIPAYSAVMTPPAGTYFADYLAVLPEYVGSSTKFLMFVMVDQKYFQIWISNFYSPPWGENPPPPESLVGKSVTVRYAVYSHRLE